MKGRRTLSQQYQDENLEAKGYLYHLEDREDELEELKNPPADRDEGMPRGPGVGDPTSSQAVALTNPEIVRMEKWLDAIRDMETRLPLHLRIFLKHRRLYRNEQGPKGWVYPTQKGYAADIAAETGQPEEKTWRSRNTMYRYSEELIHVTVRLAIRRGLL